MNTHIAILGNAPGFERAPWQNPAWEMWALNDAYLSLAPAHMGRVTRWFELHQNTALTQHRRPANHWLTLAALGIPVYTFARLPRIEHQVLYPLEAIERAMPRAYFACTFSYQIALALFEGATAIGLYGTPLVGNREALVERPCVEWWLGYAEGKGVTIHVDHNESEGLMTHEYQYAKDDPHERMTTFHYVLQHQRYLTDWLMREACRLDVAKSEP